MIEIRYTMVENYHEKMNESVWKSEPVQFVQFGNSFNLNESFRNHSEYDIIHLVYHASMDRFFYSSFVDFGRNTSSSSQSS